MEFQTATLHNGIRIIHSRIDGMVAHCGLMVNAGSRDESGTDHGMAHLIEHMLFKGTRKRKAYHVLSRMEDVGGEINAYTAKEETCIHASFLREDYERALELFSDVIFNSVFPASELIKEKEVIYDEINSYKDNPAESIFDDFEENLFPGNPLGRNILGTPQSLKSIKRDDLLAFITNHYLTNHMVIASIGNISFERFHKMADKYYGAISENTGRLKRIPGNHRPFYRKKRKNTHQVHGILGNVAFPEDSHKRTTLLLLSNILGGPGLNSRLNLSLREKYGYAYNIESSYNVYSDMGLFSVYFGTDEKNLTKTLSKIWEEFNRLKNKKLGIQQLKKAKKQMAGQVMIKTSNYENRMLSAGKRILLFNQVEDVESIIERIHQLSADEIMAAANELLDEHTMSTLIYY